MDLNDLVANAEKQKESQSSYGLKNGRIKPNKDNNYSIAVRILPGSPNNNNNIAEEYSSIWLNAMSKQGIRKSRFVMSPNMDDPQDPLTEAVKRWRMGGKYPNAGKYGNRPTLTYIYNAVPLIETNVNGQTQLVEERDEQGNYKVCLLELRSGWNQQLIDLYRNQKKNPYNTQFGQVKAQEYNINPTEQQMSDSFFNTGITFPVTINRVESGGRTNYLVDVDMSTILKPLDASWVNQLEDLKAQAEPTYVHQPNRVMDAIARGDAEVGTSPLPDNMNVPTFNGGSKQAKDPFSAQKVSTPLTNQQQSSVDSLNGSSSSANTPKTSQAPAQPWPSQTPQQAPQKPQMQTGVPTPKASQNASQAVPGANKSTSQPSQQANPFAGAFNNAVDTTMQNQQPTTQQPVSQQQGDELDNLMKNAPDTLKNL